ncbi:MAG: cytochrome c-type biogenesis protein [Gammaproteobacteria bacterium]
MKKIILLNLLFSICFIQGNEVYKFHSLEDEERFYDLIQEIRCPKCTSGSIASSNAPVSEDLKNKIAELINEGYSDKEIKEYAKDRFGNEVLYNPEVNSSTYLLWYGPFIFLFMILTGFFFRRKSQ